MCPVRLLLLNGPIGDMTMASIKSTASPIRQYNQIAVRSIGVADLRDALASGVRDFLAIPTQLVFLCILYPIIGLVAARASASYDVLPLLFPLVSGLALVGPVLAIGLYELSTRREQGLPVSWLNAFDVLRSPSILSIAALGLVLFMIFFAWLTIAKAIYVWTMGDATPASIGDLAQQIMGSRSGWLLIAWGNLVGGLFAILVLTITVVSFPMLVDRDVGPIVAVRTSVRAVLANPITMAVWGLMVAVILLLGCLPLFLGLAVAMPVLGHASWHLYRKLVMP